MPGGPEALDAAVRFAWRLCVPADEASPTGKMTWDNFLTMARKVFLVTKLRSHNAVVDPIECLHSVKRDWEHCAAFKPYATASSAVSKTIVASRGPGRKRGQTAAARGFSPLAHGPRFGSPVCMKLRQ